MKWYSKSTFVKLFLRLFASWTTPVIGQVLKSNTVMRGGIIDIAADGANVDSGRFLFSEIDLGEDHVCGIFQIHHNDLTR